MSRTLEELYIKKLEGAIRGIKMGTKNPSDVGLEVSNAFTKLKQLNDGMADDLMQRYKKIVDEHNQKKIN